MDHQSAWQIMVDSVPGVERRSSFTCLVQQQFQEAPPAIVGAARQEAEAILLAEDDETVRGLVRGILENAGYTIRGVRRRDALRSILRIPIVSAC
jgi:hypothetical protein